MNYQLFFKPAIILIILCFITSLSCKDDLNNREFKYFPAGKKGLLIYNISDPSSPTLAGSYDTDGDARDVSINGKYAFVADSSNGLVIINVNDPENPIFAGNYTTDSITSGGYSDGEYFFLADGDNGLIILNISDPTNPTLIGSYDTDGNARDITINGNYAYLADGDNGLIILNISDLSNPIFEGSYNIPAQNDWDNHTYKICVRENYAYILSVLICDEQAFPACDDIYTLLIIDISNPENPIPIGTYDADMSILNDICLNQNYAYIANGSNGFEIIDVSDPTNPTRIGSLDWEDMSNIPTKIIVNGQYAYVFGYHTVPPDNLYGLSIINISNPANPILIGTSPDFKANP